MDSGNPAPLSDSQRQTFRTCEATIEAHIHHFFQVADALITIQEQQLYREHYPTFSAYCESKWGFGSRYANYLIRAKRLVDALKDIGVENGPKSEVHTRPLTSLPVHDAATVWDRALEAAQQNAGRMSASIVQKVTDEYLVEKSRWRYLSDLVNDGCLPVKQARQAMIALDSCEPSCAAYMESYGITDAPLILEMNRLYKSGSDVFETIVSTGYLQFDEGNGVKFRQASLRDLRRMLDEHRSHHTREESIARGAILVKLYTGDAQKTWEQLRKYLPADDLRNLAAYILQITERQ